MSRGGVVLATLTASLLVAPWAPAAHAASADPASDAVATPSAAPDGGHSSRPQVWLRGPFGRVPGGPPADPTTAAPLGRPLDAFVRRAPLTVEWDENGLVVELEVVARPLDADSAPEVLTFGAPVFQGPDRVGQAVVSVTLTMLGGESSEHAWLLDVPDREPPGDGLFDIPAPDVLVGSSAGEMAGYVGEGCYIYLCVDAGRRPPPRALEPLCVDVGETLALRLADGSAFTAWKGSLERLGPGVDDMREAHGFVAGASAGALRLAGLEAGAAGEWLLSLEVELDRERGWLQTVYRLVAQAPPVAGIDAEVAGSGDRRPTGADEDATCSWTR